MKNYRKFQSEIEEQMAKPEFWKNKKTDALIEKYRQAAGEIIENGFFMVLSVIDIPGLPIKVSESKAAPVGFSPKWYFDLTHGWTGTINGEEIVIFANANAETDHLEDIIEFAQGNGVRGLTEKKIQQQINALKNGFKVQEKLSANWVMFSPIIQNGIQFRFIKDASGKSYIA